MLAREDRLVVLAGRHVELVAQERRRSLVAGVRGLGREGHLLALDVLDFLHARPRVGDDFHLVAVRVVLRGHHREGHEAGAVDRDGVRPGVEAGNVKPAGPHGLYLRRVRLHREELNPLSRHLFRVFKKTLSDLCVNRRILHRPVSEDERGRIDQLARLLRRVGDEIAVLVLVTGIEGEDRGRGQGHPKNCNGCEQLRLEGRRRFFLPNLRSRRDGSPDLGDWLCLGQSGENRHG